MKYNTIADHEIISRTVEKLKANNFEPIVVASKNEALKKIQELVPSGASVMNGSSVTLNEIGYIDLLKEGKHSWVNLHEGILAEKNPEKSSELRRQATSSDFYLGSVHALTEDGQFLIASNTGSQMPNIVFNSNNLIFVVGAQKIVPDIMEAFKRVDVHIVPLEDARMMQAYGAHTLHSKTFIYHRERENSGRKIYVIIVEEKLGF